jgi:GNAT superfamily N-acetyltransferase
MAFKDFPARAGTGAHPNILLAAAVDAPAISQLILGLAHHFLAEASGGGAGAFLQSVSPSAICTLIESPAMRYCKAICGGQLAGVVAVRDNTHLYHLFVDPAYQGQGLGRTLWLHARDIALANGNAGSFTVNSTVYAVPVYERFGFRATSARVEKNGVAFVPMQLAPTPLVA